MQAARGLVGEGLHAGSGVGRAAVLGHEPDDLGRLGAALSPAANDAADARAVLLRGAVQRRDERQRHLALLEVQADGLAGARLGVVVEEVVADLEGQPERLADGRRPLDLGRRGAGGGGADGHARREEARRLVRDDPEVGLLGRVQRPRLLDLVELALGHPSDRRRNGGEEVHVAGVEREQQAAAEQVVAEEHADFVAPERVDGRHAAPRLRLVHHVVVDERRGVEELDEGCAAVALLRHAARHLGGEQDERRADLLALLLEQVPRNGVQQAHVRPHRLPKVAPEVPEVRLDRRAQRGKAGEGDGGGAGRKCRRHSEGFSPD